MTSRRLDLSTLPHWPRFLPLAQAAAWAGVSPDVFVQEVKAGIWPPARMRGAKGSLATWDRVLMEAAADKAAGLIEVQPSVTSQQVSQEIDDSIRSYIRAQTEKRDAQKNRQKTK